METLAEMDAEIDNVRLAWSWMVAHPQRQIANIAKSLRSLWRFHDIRGRFQDGAAPHETGNDDASDPGWDGDNTGILNTRLCSGERWHSRDTFVHGLDGMKKPTKCCSKA